VDDRFDIVLPDQRGDQRLVADIADDQLHPLGQRLGKSGREIVEHQHPLAGIDEIVHRMAADIARAARDQDGHGVCPRCCFAGLCGVLYIDRVLSGLGRSAEVARLLNAGYMNAGQFERLRPTVS